MSFRPWFAVVGGLFLSACASTPAPVSGPHLTVTEAGALPVPSPSDLSTPSFPYVVAPFDRLSIEVYGVEGLTRTVQADANGNISFPMVGEVASAGLTPSQLARAIEERLVGRYVRNPQVLVTLTESDRRVVTVGGEVKEPGMYPIVGRMTLTQAIARAKGGTEFAQMSHVVIFRTVNGQRMAALHDLRSIRSGVYEDPLIYPQDVIDVGESQARRFFRYAVDAAGLITAPLIIALQN